MYFSISRDLGAPRGGLTVYNSISQDNYHYFIGKYLKLSMTIFITPCKDFIITSLWLVFGLPEIAPMESQAQISSATNLRVLYS